MIAAPAPAPTVVAATAVPIGAPSSSAPQAQVVDAEGAPPNAGFAEKAVLEAKIMRQVPMERQCTDMFWGILFLVAVVVQYGLGFYEIGNALKVTSEKWASLDAKQSAGTCSIWNEGETADINGISHRIVYSLEGPTEEQTPALPAWDQFQSTGTCGSGGLATWSSSDTPVELSCSPPNNNGWHKAGSYSAGTYGVCPPPPPPPVAATTATGATCEFTNDDECDEPQGTGSCAAGTDTADCGGSGRRRVQTRSRSSRNRAPAPPPEAISYAVLATNYSSSSGVMVFESRNKGEEYKWEAFTWEEANSLCADAGARLCSAEELAYGLGGGCTVAESLVWAADECDGGHVAVSASSMGGTLAAIDGLDMQCAATCEDMNRAVKCCADTTAAKAAESMRVFDATDVAETDAKPPKHKTLQEKKQKESDDDGFTGGGFLSGMLVAVLVCVLISGLTGLGYIYSMRENPRCMTIFANVFFLVILFLVGLFVMSIGGFIFGLILWLIAAIGVCMLFCWRAQLELAAKLLGMAAQTLLDNGGLIPVKALLMVAEIFVTLPVIVFNVTSYFQEGDWDQIYQEPGNPDCLEVCTFAYGPSVSRYFHQFMLIWVGMLFMEIMVHTIAGATAMWYFHRDDPDYMPSSPAFTALKWSLSSGFGSLAMAAFILTVVRIIVMMIREAERQAREDGGGAAVFIMCILRCIAETLEAWIQFITKISTIVVAITNDEFWPSCKRTMGMFYRCYCEGIMIERFASITMNFFSMAVALVMFVLSYFLLGAVLSDEMLESMWIPWVPAIVVAIIAYLTLTLLSGGILVIINSLYVSYLVDLDNETAPNETTMEIHQVYKEAMDMCIGTMDTNGKNYKKSGAYRRQFDQQNR